MKREIKKEKIRKMMKELLSYHFW